MQQQTIGHTIKLLRTVARLKQKDLAEKAGIKANYLSLVEAGRREPSLTVVRAIAKVLDVPVSFLFWESEAYALTNRDKKEDSLVKLKRLVLEMESLRLANQE